MHAIARLTLALAVALAPCVASASDLGQRASSVAQDSLVLVGVRAKLLVIDADSATNVRVDVSRGVVTLTGQAHSNAERHSYAAAAASIPDVKSVRDELSVDPHLRGISEEGKDAGLEVRVSAAIAAQAGANVFRVTPVARRGVVTLRGSVPNRAVESVVVRAAHVSGVTRVINDLAIHP